MLHAVVDVAQREDDAGLQAQLGLRRHDGVHAVGHAVELAVLLDVVEQVHAEVVEPEIGDRDAGLDVFQLDDFVLQPAQLLLAVDDVVDLAVSTLSSPVAVTSAITMRFSTRSLRLMYSSSVMSGQ